MIKRLGLSIFFQPDDNVDLACRVLAIADWAEEFNRMSTNSILDILVALQSLYSGPLQAWRQFPLLPSSEKSGVMDEPGHRLCGFTCVPSCNTMKTVWPPRKVPFMGEKPEDLVPSSFTSWSTSTQVSRNLTGRNGITLSERHHGLPLETI